MITKPADEAVHGIIFKLAVGAFKMNDNLTTELKTDLES
jgi:hypothetical protein